MLNVQYGKRFIAMTERTLLAQMLWDMKEAGEGLSYSKMAARSGGLVAVSTLHSVMSGKTKELTPDTINGLARILNVSAAHVLAALNDKPLPDTERASEEKERIWAMYEDIPRQCQQDVLDLLQVLQRNHSISARKARQAEKRERELTPAAARDDVQVAELPYGDEDTLPPTLPHPVVANGATNGSRTVRARVGEEKVEQENNSHRHRVGK